jgi:hypothetical protein
MIRQRHAVTHAESRTDIDDIITRSRDDLVKVANGWSRRA